MAQSQISAYSLGEPIEIWSQRPGAPVAETPGADTPEGALSVAIGEVLSAWRAAERQLDDLVEASPMRFVVLSEISRLRAEYGRLVALKIR